MSTDTNTPGQPPHVPAPAGTASGRDLARQALAAYKSTARTGPAAPTSRVRNRNRRRTGEDREPQAFGSLIGRLAAEQGWHRGVAGGSVIDKWAELCPQYADGQVAPVHYDPDRGRLDLRPSTHAYAAQLRLLGGQLARQINDKSGRDVVRSIRVLPVGATTSPAAAAAEMPGRPVQPQQLVKTREMASPGYREALELALAHRPEQQPLNPLIAAAVARQTEAARANRLPWEEHREAVAACEEQAGPEPGSVEASLAEARAYKRRVQAGLESAEPRRAFDVA